MAGTSTPLMTSNCTTAHAVFTLVVAGFPCAVGTQTALPGETCPKTQGLKIYPLKVELVPFASPTGPSYARRENTSLPWRLNSDEGTIRDTFISTEAKSYTGQLPVSKIIRAKGKCESRWNISNPHHKESLKATFLGGGARRKTWKTWKKGERLERHWRAINHVSFTIILLMSNLRLTNNS